MDKVQEQLLLKNIYEGDENAFSTLYDYYWEALFLYLIKVLKDRDEACDLVQETFISIWQQREVLLNIRSIKAYLFTIARYKALKLIKDNKLQYEFIDSLTDFVASSSTGTPEECLINRELSDFIDMQIDSLPVKMRNIFVMSRNGNFSYREIAERLDLSENTVKKQIRNSLRYLKLKINHYNYFFCFFI